MRNALILLFLSSTALAQTETPLPIPPAPEPTMAPMPQPTPDPTPAAAKPEVTTSVMKLKVGGQLWPTYRFDLSEGAEDRNEFDVTRAYVTVQPILSETVDARITLEIVPQGAVQDGTGATVGSTNTTGSMITRLKFGHINWRPIGPVLELIAGAAPSPWIFYEEDIWGYRVLGETAMGTFYGVRAADIGYGAKVKLLDGRVEVHSAVHNGESTVGRETNKYKETATRASVRILGPKDGGLKLGAYYGFALTEQDAEKVRMTGLLSWQSKRFVAAGGYIVSQDGDGDGLVVTGSCPYAFGHVVLPVRVPGYIEELRVLGRVDLSDPDVDVADDGVTRLIAGVQMFVHEKSSVIFDYQQRSFESADLDPARAAFVHWEIRF